MTRPRASETSEATKNQSIDFTPTRPTAAASSMWAMPTTRVEKTRGAIIILISRRNIVLPIEITGEKLLSGGIRDLRVDDAAHGDAENHRDQNVGYSSNSISFQSALDEFSTPPREPKSTFSAGSRHSTAAHKLQVRSAIRLASTRLLRRLLPPSGDLTAQSVFLYEGIPTDALRGSPVMSWAHPCRYLSFPPPQRLAQHRWEPGSAAVASGFRAGVSRRAAP